LDELINQVYRHEFAPNLVRSHVAPNKSEVCEGFHKFDSAGPRISRAEPRQAALMAHGIGTASVVAVVAPQARRDFCLSPALLLRFFSKFTLKFYYAKKKFPSHQNVDTYMEY
jgi:hypothetical protein